MPSYLAEPEAALFEAARTGNGQAVQFFIDAGVNPNRSPGHSDFTSLGIAAAAGHLRIVQQLLSAGADINWGPTPPLCYAATQGQLEVVKCLVRHGAQLDSAVEVGGCTSLYLAAQRGHLGVVRFLVQAGADVEKKTQCVARVPCTEQPAKGN